ncbi:EpsI family protein [Leptothrix cholodnii SP-6]|uniref:EpsI family protein n=1 Tax=Leptothrix cholodnii (strain ATCC 51168 / LMG 8142 / SP-6) TaxID=395495 RepID=B1Y4Q3_LEPCP|nr:exosortase-associated protein EpsI, B-type [Leptothrix cholodnii]ACB34616.1 EpsI family protein [Leptothrix cholodnii SP-6]
MSRVNLIHVNAMPTKNLTSALILAAAMAVTAAFANHLKPTLQLADTRPVLKIEPSIPTAFSGWRLAEVSGGVVNPQQEELLNSLYSEIVTRTYVNEKGQRVMLSIAYGKNQSDSFQVHKPEICYPAQGFQLKSNVAGTLETTQGQIPVRRIETSLGGQRQEPVTYWTTIGDHAVRSGVDKKIKEIEYAMKGYIADGLLFRVSSIDDNTARAFELQQQFASDLLASIPADDRFRLSGLR